MIYVLGTSTSLLTVHAVVIHRRMLGKACRATGRFIWHGFMVYGYLVASSYGYAARSDDK